MKPTELLRRAIAEKPQDLFRRYFINTLFDSTFVVLGILAAAAFVPEPNSDIAVGAIFAACFAIGISTAASVYEAEHIEAEIEMQKLERAMLSPMHDTEVERTTHASVYVVAAVNFMAPIFVSVIMGTPLLLYEVDVIRDFRLAAMISSLLGISIIFAAGYYLGRFGRARPWLRAVRMSVVALLAFGALILFEQLILS
ncbi:MAG: hypothetical protein JSV94_06535 [Methanobacteriota archaeon]|nr:MAG: hypothetical protein JSV94_06535 [Euryarchaeota archaeon]